MQIFSEPSSIALTPQSFSAVNLIGQNSTVSVINFQTAANFQYFVSNTPLYYFAWRFFGAMTINTAGSYKLCSTSDDGSLVYINSGTALNIQSSSNYTLIISDDGPHGATIVCASLTLQSQVYNIMVIEIAISNRFAEIRSLSCVEHSISTNFMKLHRCLFR